MDGILFDLNNCLVYRPDIPLAIAQAVRKAVSEAGYKYNVPEQFLTDSWLTERGKNRSLLFWQLLHHCKVDVEFRRELVQRCEELYKSSKDYSLVKPYQDIHHIFELDIPTGVITNSSPKTTEKILSSTGLKFDHTFADGGKENLIESAKEKMGEIILVGDSTEDICMGKQHEIFTVAMDRKIVPLNRLLRARPDLIISSLEPLNYLLGNLQNSQTPLNLHNKPKR